MLLYHGSNVIVNKPKIIISDKGRDFGYAFYLTPIQEQAERWAKRKAKLMKEGTPTISVFEWNEDHKGIAYKRFSKPDMEWLDMVVQCRSNLDYRHPYDIVEGKIADDSVGETILFVLDGVMKREDALEKLKFQKINSQIAFCSEASLRGLTFLRSYEVK